MAESNREEIAKLEALYAGNPGGRVFVHLAEAYRKAGEHERARRILDEGLARHVDSASGHVVLGRVLADMQIMGEAETAFRRVLQLDGGNLVALRWLGDLARQSGRNSEAAAHYRELLVRNPSNEEVRDLVEIVEREAASPAPRAEDADRSSREDADAGADWSTEGHDDLAVSGPVSESEERAVSPPAGPDPRSDRDVTPWSAAPGQTEDTAEPDVEFGLVEIDVDAQETDVPPQEADVSSQEADVSSHEADVSPWETEVPAHGAGAEPFGARGRDDESDVVASFDDEDGALLELDELRRDDEAEPVEIHLLDPSYEPREGEADEFVGELDLSDLEAASAVEEEEDYADDSFIADLASTGREEPPEDELPAVVDLMTDDSALTLLPDETDAVPAEEAAPPSGGGSGYVGFADPGVADEYLQDSDAAHPPAGEFVDEGGDAPEPAADGSESAVVEFEPTEAGEPGMAALTELSGAAEPATEAEPVSDMPREADIGLVTETMALLYRSQGFHERAADVYRALLRSRPDDERLAARLREAEAAASPTAGASAGDEPAEDAGEVWLRGVATAWTAPQDAAVHEATPYAWTADADEAETGEPIGSYLKDLVTWKAGTRRWMEQQGEPEPEPDEADGGIELPDWLNDPAGSGHWTPDSEPAGFEPVAAADAGWSPAESVVDSDPWAVPDEPETAAAPESQQAHSDMVEGVAPPAAAEAPEAVDPLSAPVAGGGSDAGWTPLDLDGSLSSPASVEPLPPLPEPVAEEEEDSAEDEDLEMFRTWLQSLKK